MITQTVVDSGKQATSAAQTTAEEKKRPTETPTIGTAEFVAMLGICRATFCKLRSKGVIPPPLLDISYPRWSRAFVQEWIDRNGPTIRRK